MPDNTFPLGSPSAFDEFLARYLEGERARAARSLDLARYLSARTQELLQPLLFHRVRRVLDVPLPLIDKSLQALNRLQAPLFLFLAVLLPRAALVRRDAPHRDVERHRVQKARLRRLHAVLLADALPVE